MNHIFRFFAALILTSLALNGCRTSTDPNTGIQPGMRATINGTLWVADSTIVVKSGTCITLMGWTGSSPNTRMISIGFSTSQIAPDSCPPNGNYSEGINQLYAQKGSLFLASKTSTNLQGTFAFRGVVFRSSDSTFITNGEFNLDFSN